MKKPIIFAAPAALALLALAYFVVLPMLKAKPVVTAADGPEAGATPSARHVKHKPAEPGLIFPLQERVLNLASTGGAQHYARIELAMEFVRPQGSKPAKPAPAAAKSTAVVIDPALDPVSARLPQINDALVRIVGSRTVDAMTSTEGKDAFKKEFMDAIDQIVPAPDLQAVYIVQLVVQ